MKLLVCIASCLLLDLCVFYFIELSFCTLSSQYYCSDFVQCAYFNHAVTHIGHFLKNLKSQLPQTRILAISALNTLLKESPYKSSLDVKSDELEDLQEHVKSSLEGTLTQTFQEEGFFTETLTSLSHVHIISDTETASRGSQGDSSFQSLADKSITRFYFEFSASWPRTPSWISFLGSDTFYSSFARIFKRLVQECGMPVVMALRGAVDDFTTAKERSKQCVAAEALAGVLHSDIDGLSGTWESWLMPQLKNIILTQSVESVSEWASCIRYAVTGKGKYGTRVPLLRQKILDSLMTSLPPTVATTVTAKRYTFLAAALIEISPQKMPVSEIQLHNTLLKEVLGNMCHSSAQVSVPSDIICSISHELNIFLPMLQLVSGNETTKPWTDYAWNS